MQSLEEYLLEQLEKHINIDYNLFENAGLYDGIEELAMFLTNKIRSHQEKEFKLIYKDTDRELSKFKNIFFKSISICCERCNTTDNTGRYEINDVIDYDNKTDKFNYITIKCELSVSHNQNEIYLIFLHELTHAWDNYNHIKKYGNKSLNDVFINTKYDEVAKLMNSSDGLYSFVGLLLYFINPMKVNAFMGSFASYLYDTVNDNRIEDPHKALNIIKSSQLYKNYVQLGAFVQKLYDNDAAINKYLIKYICKEYNRVYCKNYTESKIKKTIYWQYKKVLKKIESNIGKLCVRYTKNLSFKDINPNSIKIENLCSL